MKDPVPAYLAESSSSRRSNTVSTAGSWFFKRSARISKRKISSHSTMIEIKQSHAMPTNDIGVEMRHLEKQRIFIPLALDNHLGDLWRGRWGFQNMEARLVGGSGQARPP
jgi:hypothetical protein